MSNEHRKTKRSFQALLSQEENELVNSAKVIIQQKTDKELLLTLVKLMLSKGWVCDDYSKNSKTKLS